jgi:hypothetical protein
VCVLGWEADRQHVFESLAGVGIQRTPGFSADGVDHLLAAERPSIRAVGAERFGDVGDGKDPRR